MYDSGKELKEIADIVGCSSSRVCQIVKEQDRSPFLRRYPHIRDMDVEQLISDYQNGMLVREILDKYHTTYKTLYDRLEKAGIPRRPRPSMTGPKNGQYKHGKGSRNRERTPELTKQVAALCLGHIVPRGWIIHHLDENPSNNNPENLVIFRSGRGHARFHQQQLRLQREGAPIDAIQLVLENDGFPLPLPTRPIVLPREKDRLCPHKS
jgi:hypothetical protein